MKDVAVLVGTVVIAIIVVVLLGLLLSFPVMLLWNYCLVPAVPGLGELSWLQAWGIFILSGMLFKSNNIVKK